MLGSCEPGRGQGHERDDLNIDEVAELLADVHEGLHAAEPDRAAQITVGANRREPIGHARQHCAAGALDDVVVGEGRPRRLPGHDRAEQVAGDVADAVGGVGLVEVCVRLGRRGQEEIARDVVHFVGGKAFELTHRGDAVALETDVDGRPVVDGRSEQ